MNILKKASFWKLITQSMQMGLGVAQGITIAADAQHVWNYAFAGAQVMIGIITLWTKDENFNDEVDILEDKPIVKVTAPDSVRVEVKEEKNE